MRRRSLNKERGAPLSRRLGHRAKALRRACGLTQEELAHRAGLAVAYLARLESGSLNPTLGTLSSLARGLNISPAELLGDEDTEGGQAHSDSISGEIRRLVMQLSDAERATLLRIIRAYSPSLEKPSPRLVGRAESRAAEQPAAYKPRKRKPPQS